MRYREQALASSLPAEQANRGEAAPLAKHPGFWCLPSASGKGHFFGHQGQCTGRAVPCIASHVVRLSVSRQQVLTFIAFSPDGCVRRAAEGWEREPGLCRKGWRIS